MAKLPPDPRECYRTTVTRKEHADATRARQRLHGRRFEIRQSPLYVAGDVSRRSPALARMTVSGQSPAMESLESLREADVTTVRLLYPDLHGVARGKDIPFSQFAGIVQKGIGFCAAVMATDLRHNPITEDDERFPDLIALPDLGTLRVVPWQPTVAWCLSDLREVSGGAFPACPRNALRAAVGAFAELGLTPI